MADRSPTCNSIIRDIFTLVILPAIAAILGKVARHDQVAGDLPRQVGGGLVERGALLPKRWRCGRLGCGLILLPADIPG